MDTSSDQVRLLQRYLLGDVSEEEQIAIESLYFTDGEAFENLLALEDELTFRYFANSLSKADRRRFEARYLTAASRKKSFVQALISFVDKQPRAVERRRFWFPLVTAAGFAALAVFAVSVSSRLTRFEAQLPAKSVARVPVVLSFLLEPGLRRGADVRKDLTIPASANVVRFQLEPGRAPRYSAYRATLRNAGNVETWSQTMSTDVVELPASVIVPGEYTLILEGRNGQAAWEEAEDYHFRIVYPPH